MAKYNSITEGKFKQIKKECKVPADDPAAIKKYGVCATTVQRIRLSADYQAYCERVFRYHGHPKGRRGSVITKAPQKRTKTLKDTNKRMSVAEFGSKIAPWVLLAVCIVGLIILGIK